MDAPTQAPAPGAEIESVLRAARDAASEDIVARLSESASQAVELLDRVNRSGIADALPAIAEMVRTGDLERIARYARVLGAAEDALTEDMVGRFAALAAEVTVMADRFASKLPALLDNLERVDNMLACMAQAANEVEAAPAPGGGLLALLAMLRDAENQKALRFFLAASRRLRASAAGG